MISLRLNTVDFNNTFRNAVAYSQGFLKGVERGKLTFNTQLGEATVEILNKYIDSRARMNPEELHHVYEWNRVGTPSGRLFELEANATQRSIWITGRFLQSKSMSEGSEEPFADKANVMENKIAIEIEPRDSDVLVFESEGQTIFTPNSIYIDNPGGDAVAGSFGRVIEEFFESYFTPMVLTKSGIIKDLSTAEEFAQYFGLGAKSGMGPGITAGQKYMTIMDVTKQ